ncbi:MAG TPA: alpha/beta hydrolase [Candidatus Saccharimonadales bacterium]|nr:alpha/beta hydrolase [Candidatus Saccharimonadales bacterium]
MRRRASIRLVAGLALLFAMLAAPPAPVNVAAAGATLVITDSIAPGIVTGSLGLATDTVGVPSGGFVTLLVTVTPALAGRTMQIWSEHTSGAWAPTTSRRIASDGTVRYFARITTFTALQARYAGDHTYAAAQGHGRIAEVGPPGRSTVRLSCDDFSAAGGGPDPVRAVGVEPGTTVEVIACLGNAGSTWRVLSYDQAAVAMVGTSISIASGTETWQFAVLQAGTDAFTLAYHPGATTTAPTRTVTVLLEMPDLPLQVTKNVSFTRPVPCGPTGSCRLQLDVYAPVGAGPWPIVILLRGGPGGLGSRSEYAALASRIASQGVTVYNADYRDMPDSGATYPRAFDDVACAVRFARSTAAEYGGDASSITIVGHSLGGYVGSVVALSANAFLEPCLGSGGGAPDAFVGIAGAYVLGAPNLQGDFDSVLGASRLSNPKAWVGGNPFSFVGRRPGVIFRLVQGSADQTVDPSASVALEHALEKYGFDSSLTMIQGASHASVIGLTPAGEQTLVVILGVVR